MYLRDLRRSLQSSTYNEVLTALARARSNVAFQVLDYMDVIGVTPNDEAYSALLQMIDASRDSR